VSAGLLISWTWAMASLMRSWPVLVVVAKAANATALTPAKPHRAGRRSCRMSRVCNDSANCAPFAKLAKLRLVICNRGQ
jgi:hypothetical protein